MENGEQPINPSDHQWQVDNETKREMFTGLTKREHFAAMAMQGILASLTEKAAIGNWGTEEKEVSKASTRYADALLKELDK